MSLEILKNTASSAMNAIGGTVSRITQPVSIAASSATKKAGDLTAGAAKTAGNVANSVKEVVTHPQEAIGNAVKTAQNFASEAQEDLSNAIKDPSKGPGVAGGTALSGGLAGLTSLWDNARSARTEHNKSMVRQACEAMFGAIASGAASKKMYESLPTPVAIGASLATSTVLPMVLNRISTRINDGKDDIKNDG